VLGVALVAAAAQAQDARETHVAGSDAAARLAAGRQRMISEQLRGRGVRDERVLDAMQRVPREEFIPAELHDRAYDDGPLPIGRGQTISQPYIVALMSESLHLSGDEKVLEVGTGSGYQAAILGLLAREVYTVEIDPDLAAEAAERLRRLGHTNVHTLAGDGYYGWPEAAPFDAIIVTAAAPRVPEKLVEQLAEGGRLVAPVDRPAGQELVLVTRVKGKVQEKSLAGVLFVPMTGAIRK
jgi:protein-L-isoaspartate(D-aspartate) O-methyltransferase